IYAERFRGRSYGSINAYAFQDLRPARPGDQPNLLPYLTYSTYGRPGATFGGRWGLQSSFLGVSRPYGGQGVQRASATADWERQWFTDIGLVNKLSASLRGDIYQVQSADPALAGAGRAGKDYGVSRIFPALQWQTSMPFVKTGSFLQYEIEPLVSFSASPRLKNAAIPNEDSLDVELDPTNLLNISRFPGLDRVEDGQRFTYGMRGRITNRNGGYLYSFIGQSFRLNGNHAFPVGSGLDDDTSDIVAQVNAVPSRYLDLDYRTRLDDATLAPQRHELTLNAGPSWLRIGSTYAFLKQVQNTGINLNRQQIINSAALTISDRWRLTASDIKDLDDGAKSLVTTMGIQYIDERFSILFNAQRDYTQRVGINSGDSFYITFSFKNLGEVTTPTFNTLAPGGQISSP
nr:LPS assembly protein LptD [Alphaproteobacteria bacterium]